VNSWGKIVDSIKERGLRRTVEIILSKLGDFWYDIRFGTNTVRCIELYELEIKSENKYRGRFYQPTSARAFKALMNILDFPSDSVFVDLGAGKGKVLLMARDYGFKRVVGVEFSHELCEIAKRNLSVYRRKAVADVDVEIIESDVVDYEIKDEENVFFLYNPFDPVVMSSVLRNVDKSLEKKPRRIWLIYLTPVHRDVIERHRGFAKLGEYILGGSEFIVYVSGS
jgi:predicted RNA methylase